ncbi:hypothetical protein TrCOL_g139 [Triparma columacea]|uniref:Uncharacterized protein n=1 Tax=Triparma columacea TaxID=722753 RepID=A0A9W7GJ81_9STRA|nr:hypothetical protein TrCOL_g139 [Triparma columacea]
MSVPRPPPLLSLISRLSPLKRIGATVVQGPRIPYILAYSDPYLSTAKPVKDGALPPEDVEARIIFMPSVGSTSEPQTLRLLNSRGLEEFCPEGIIPHVILPPPKLKLDYIKTCLSTNAMWDSVGVTKDEIEAKGGVTLQQSVDTKTLAAIYLQHTIDNELGGWSNSFG